MDTLKLHREHVQSSTSQVWENLDRFAERDSKLSQALDVAREAISGHVTIDIGCGAEDFMANRIIDQGGEYIGVDRLKRGPFSIPKAVFVHDDALQFISSPKSMESYRKKGCNFVINGFEGGSITEDYTTVRMLVQQMVAKMTPGSVIFGVNSPAIAEHLTRNESLEPLYEYSENGSTAQAGGRRFFVYRFKGYDLDEV